MTRFPLSARRTLNDTVGLCDAFGYWARLGGDIIELPVEQEALVVKIADAVNAAFQLGRADAQATMREALGIVDVD